jgi:hypothetical protein
MILIEKTEVIGFEQAIRGMRNPMNSWNKSDSGICKGGDDGIGCINCAYTYISDGCKHTYDHSFQVGKNDYDLMMKLVKGGPVHAKFRRMIAVYVDITAPLYWWKEFDTYKVGTVANSCSTMHKIHEKEFTLDDFSHEHLISRDEGWDDFTCSMENGEVVLHNCSPMDILQLTCNMLNFYRNLYLKESHPDDVKADWWQMIQLLPSSYNQKRTVMLNYEVLAGIYEHRKNHKLDEWKEFCKWIDLLPWSKIITCNSIKEDKNEH